MRSRRRTSFTLAALALAGASLSSCGGSPELARVGTETITVAEYDEAARAAGMRYPGPPDSAKRLLLEDLVRRELLLAHARRKLDADSLVLEVRKTAEDEVLGAALAERLAPPDIPVSSAEVREFHAWRATATRVQLIYTVERNVADAALEQIRHGVPFADAANHYNLPGLLPPGGDLGYVLPGTLVNPLDRLLREAPVGQLIGPIEAPGEGWFLIRVIERRPNPQEPVEVEAQTLSDMLRQRKRRIVSVRAFDHLKRQYRVQVRPGGAQAVYAWANGTGPFADTSAGGGDRIQAERLAERMPIATYEDRSGHRVDYTFGEAIHEIESSADRINFAMLPAIKQWVESRLVRRVSRIEGRRRLLDQEPAIAARIEQRVDEYLLETIYSSEVINEATPTQLDMQTALSRRAAALIRLDEVRVQHLTVPDSASAVRLIELARRGGTLSEAIMYASPGMQSRDETVTFPTEDPVWTALRPAFIQASPGQFLAPAPAGDGRWRVVQMIAKRQEEPTLENLPDQVRQMIMAEAAEVARERRLDEVIASLRREFAVTVDENRLRRLPWPATPSGLEPS